MPISEIIDGMISLIKKNMIARNDIVQNVSPGATTIFIQNAFRFDKDEEITVLDNGYNDENSSHYRTIETVRIKSVDKANQILTLYSAINGSWLVANSSFVQKTIGHVPLFESNVYYGDREVVPVDDMAIAIEPESMSNEWMYLQGGLSEEYRVKILIYGRSIKTEEGMKILNKYTDSVYKLFNDNIHMDINDYDAYLTRPVVIGDTFLYISNTAENLENIVPYQIDNWVYPYMLQNNIIGIHNFQISNVQQVGGELKLTMDYPATIAMPMSTFPVLKKNNRYLYDSRIDNVTYGVSQKASAFIRASELSWFGKEINELTFPQPSKGIESTTPA